MLPVLSGRSGSGGAYSPNFRVGNTSGTTAASKVIEQMTGGFDPRSIGKLSLEDVQRLSATAEEMAKQEKFAKHACKKIKEILKRVATIEELRAEILKEGLAKDGQVAEMVAELTKQTNQAGLDRKLLQEKTANALQYQGAQYQANAGLDRANWKFKLLQLRQGTELKLQSMGTNHKQTLNQERQRIRLQARTAQARATYNRTLADAMDGKISARQASGLLAKLQKLAF
ncbi:hypothetical protein SPB21_07605 [Leptothoe sp. ISB3NOV94-8A]|nr:hypothetical protein Lepto7375DRAFT_1795 [Leptolyngbya sp. PCC 7375]